MTAAALRLLPFLAWRHRVNRATLRLDLLAGLVAAVLVLPQGVAFATLAGMPPEYGLYGAMLPAIVGALWGSSWHLVSGPTNATSLMVFATVSAFATPFTPAYVSLVLTLNLMVGLIKLGLGVARLGTLVNFISTAVVIGFTAGAGLLIIGAQLRNFFGIDIPQDASFLLGIRNFIAHIGETDPAILAVGAVTLLVALAGKRFLPQVPYMSRIPSGAAPLFVDRSFRIVAHLHPSESVPEGVVVSLGDLSGGFTLFVRDRRLVFEYNCEGTPCRVESAASAVDARSHTLELAFTRTQNLAGEATLLVDGRPVGCGEIPRTAKWFISWSALDVGRDSLSRVSDVYADAFPFTPGALARVDFELEPVTQPVDHAPID